MLPSCILPRQIRTNQMQPITATSVGSESPTKTWKVSLMVQSSNTHSLTNPLKGAQFDFYQDHNTPNLTWPKQLHFQSFGIICRWNMGNIIKYNSCYLCLNEGVKVMMNSCTLCGERASTVLSDCEFQVFHPVILKNGNILTT